MDPIKAHLLVTVLCGLVVVFYAAKRYNTPDTNWFTTTRSLFLLTGAGYITASLALFVILCKIVLEPGVLDFLGAADAQNLIAKYTATPAVLAALILTTLLPNIPVVSAWDTWLLKRFQDWGSIPQGVRNLADTLTENALPMTQADLSNLHDWMVSDGDIPNELTTRTDAGSAATPRGNLTRVLKLYHELEKLEGTPAYAKAFRIRQDAWQAIRADFRVFTAQSQAFFVLFDQLTPVEGAAGVNALKQARDRYSDICRKMYGHLVQFLAEFLLRIEGSDLMIKNRLQSLGFCIPEVTCPPLPIGLFVFMGVVISFAILAVVSVVPTPDTSPLGPDTTAILIGTTKTIGVLAAVLPKLRWSWFRPDTQGRLPYLGWLVSAGLAALVSLLFERAALGIAYHGISAALDFSHYPLTPTTPTTFILSLSIAIVCDVDLRVGHGWMRSITEGIICGLAMLATIFICLHQLKLPSTTEAFTFPLFPYVFSFSLGFVGGLVAPNVYRRYGGNEPQNQMAPEIVAHAL